MIAHVAEAGEGRGRVLVQLGCSGELSSTAIAAAVHVARAFGSEIEVLFVEDRQLLDLASYGFMREISHSGRVQRALTASAMATELGHLATSLERQMRRVVEGAGIVFRSAVLSDEPVRATAAACAEAGPWNVVTLATPLKGNEAGLIERLFSEVSEFTGLVVAGGAQRSFAAPRALTGPVVALIEDLEHVQPMMRTAERLAEAGELPIHLILAAESQEAVDWLEDQSRLALGGELPAVLATAVIAHFDSFRAADEIGRHRAGFVLARWGGRLAPVDGDLGPLARLIDAPVLLTR